LIEVGKGSTSLVATNDCRYLKKEDMVHDILLYATDRDDRKRPEQDAFSTDEFAEVADEMKEAFKDTPEP
jgi:DNA polymerase III alpha subunit